MTLFLETENASWRTAQPIKHKSSIDVRILLPLNSFEGSLGEGNKENRVMCGPSGKLPTYRREGKNQVSDSWAASTLPLLKDHFSPSNLSSVMCDPHSKNPVASEILCISNAIWTIKREKYFSICEWPSDIGTGHLHSSRLHLSTSTEAYCSRISARS